jgi:uncharacterized protein (TIGR02117 family)
MPFVVFSAMEYAIAGRMWRVLRKILGFVLGLAGAYALAALIGGYLLPMHGDWRQPWAGTRIYVVDNGIHTDLVLPARDFVDLVRPQHYREGVKAAQGWLVIGWGDRDFYMHTPSWRQADPRAILRALAGQGSTVLHVMHVREPATSANVRPINLRPQEYARLLAYIRADFAPGPVVPGYGGRDAFYPSRGAYNLIRTCNEWTAGALRAAGVRMGMWAPLPFGVMHWL